MKIIDLLNKIANGEEVPKKIIYKNIEYTYKDIGYYNKQRGYLFDGYYTEGILDDEVEILETTLNTKNMNITISEVKPSTYTKIFEELKNKIEKIGVIDISNHYSSDTDDYTIDAIDELEIGPDDDRILKDLAWHIRELELKFNKIIDKINGEQI